MDSMKESIIDETYLLTDITGRLLSIRNVSQIAN